MYFGKEASFGGIKCFLCRLLPRNEHEIELDNSVKALSEMITVNKTLEELELLTIELTLDHVLTFNHALQMNKTISSVCLYTFS